MKDLTYGTLREMVQEALKEQNVSGAVGNYNTPKAFKRISRPKRPSHTRCFDFLEENKYDE